MQHSNNIIIIGGYRRHRHELRVGKRVRVSAELWINKLTMPTRTAIGNLPNVPVSCINIGWP